MPWQLRIASRKLKVAIVSQLWCKCMWLHYIRSNLVISGMHNPYMSLDFANTRLTITYSPVNAGFRFKGNLDLRDFFLGQKPSNLIECIKISTEILQKGKKVAKNKL